MKPKHLYHVQDDDRPMYVVATSWIDALSRWKEQVSAENEESIEETAEPNGIARVCDDGDLIS